MSKATTKKLTKAKAKVKQEAVVTKPEQEKEPLEVSKVTPVEMPGFKEHQKECDIELVTNTFNAFSSGSAPTIKATHLAAMCWVAQQFGDKQISLTEMFALLKSKMDIDVESKAGGQFRTILYNDYYPQTRKGKELVVKDVDVIKYAYDDSIYFAIPLVADPDRNGRKLWGIQFKPEFVEMVKSIKIDIKKLSDNLQQK